MKWQLNVLFQLLVTRLVACFIPCMDSRKGDVGDTVREKEVQYEQVRVVNNG